MVEVSESKANEENSETGEIIKDADIEEEKNIEIAKSKGVDIFLESDEV